MERSTYGEGSRVSRSLPGEKVEILGLEFLDLLLEKGVEFLDLFLDSKVEILNFEGNFEEIYIWRKSGY